MRFLALLSLLALGCGPAPNIARSPVVQTCAEGADDDDDEAIEEAPRRKPVEYVKLRDWQPPPSVEELEAALPPRGSEPPSFTTFPQLTLHKPIGGSSYAPRWRGNVHAR